MKPQRDLPDAWAKRMVDLGLSYRGKPSARALADRAGVTVGATLRVIFRENYGEDTALALGQALRDPGFAADMDGQCGTSLDEIEDEDACTAAAGAAIRAYDHLEDVLNAWRPYL